LDFLGNEKPKISLNSLRASSETFQDMLLKAKISFLKSYQQVTMFDFMSCKYLVMKLHIDDTLFLFPIALLKSSMNWA